MSAIEAISCRWEHRDGAMQLVPGTTKAVPRHEATGREPEGGDVAFVGYVVTLQTEATAGISLVSTDCEDGS